MRYKFDEIAKRIRDERKARKLNQDSFIEKLNYTSIGLRIGRNRLTEIEKGNQSAFSLDFLYSIGIWDIC